MTNATAAAPALAQAWQDAMTKTVQRWNTWTQEFLLNPADPPMGQTPKEVIWKRGKIRLYHYLPQVDRRHALPYFIVPWLGISRPYILDMLPGHSMIAYLLQQGHDVYMLDWGDMAEEDKHLGLDDVVCTVLPRAIDAALEYAQAPALNLNGLCLGGVITACYLGLNPDAPVKNYIAIVTPVDFTQGGLFRTWLGTNAFPVELMVERFGGVPTSLMGMGFKMLRPTGDMAALSGLWFNLDKDEYIPVFKAMNHWANDYVGMPGRFFQQLTRDLYYENKLVKGELILKGRRVDLRHIHQPLLVAAASKDHIVPPLAAKGLIDAVGSVDTEYLEVPGGHISVFSGRQAHKVLWPKIDTWLAQRAR
jgi:polyhydroxyalkanoate synthase